MKEKKVEFSDGTSIIECIPENAEDVRWLQQQIDAGKAGTADQARKLLELPEEEEP